LPFFFIIKEIQDKNRFKKKIMMFNVVEKKIELKDGRVITIETGKLAKQADGAVKNG